MINQKPLGSKPKNLFTLLFFVFTSLIFAQKNSQIWEAIHNNDRKTALDLVNNLNVENDVENFFLKQITQMENGLMEGDVDVVSKISSYDDFEYYLFSSWNLTFVFGDYIENGFNSITFELPHVIDDTQIKSTTVKSGLTYLKAIAKRHQGKWNEYYDLMKTIDAVRDWEYCGVFENLNYSGIDMSYPPEAEVSNSVVFDAQSKGDAQWYKQTEDEEIYNFFLNHAEYGAGVHYAQTFIDVPNDQRAVLRLGKKGLIRLWVNDVLILDDDDHYTTELDAYASEIKLNKGFY